MSGSCARGYGPSSAHPPTRSATCAHPVTCSESPGSAPKGRARHGSEETPERGSAQPNQVREFNRERSGCFMSLTVPPRYESRWEPPPGLGDLDALVYRSNLLASDRSIVNFGGGNTSVKVQQPD